MYVCMCGRSNTQPFVSVNLNTCRQEGQSPDATSSITLVVKVLRPDTTPQREVDNNPPAFIRSPHPPSTKSNTNHPAFTRSRAKPSSRLKKLSAIPTYVCISSLCVFRPPPSRPTALHTARASWSQPTPRSVSLSLPCASVPNRPHSKKLSRMQGKI